MAAGSSEEDRKYRAEILVHYQDEILKIRDELDTAFHENLRDVPKIPNFEEMAAPIRTTLLATLDEESADEVFNPLLNSIYWFDSEEIRILKNRTIQIHEKN